MLEPIVQRFAQLREAPIKLLATCEDAQGHPFGSELRAWIRLFERYELEVCDPVDAEMRIPAVRPTMRGLIEQQSASWIADLIGFLTASSVVIQQDEMSYLASWHSTAEGHSRMFTFHPNDWGLWPAETSLAACLRRLLREDAGTPREELLPRHLDPASLFPRVDWLVHALLGVGRDWASELERAPGLDVWRKERARLDGAPHLATYWLWSHYFFDREAELDDLLEVTAGETNSVFADARDFVVELVDRGSAEFEELKKKIRFEPAESPRPDAEAELLARAANEPRVQEALALLDRLATATPFDADAAMVRLYDLVDARFRAVIEARMRNAAKFADTHREASWGLLLAAAAIADDISDFEAMLERTGTQNFGPRRMAELYRAYAKFEDRRATEILALGASRWLEELEDWIRMTPVEPVRLLLERDCLETHQLMAAILERASFSGANWEIAVAAARAAGELRSSRAVKGLERAVERQLGRVEDGTRAEVVRALFLAAGAECRGALEALAEKKIAAIKYADAADVPVLEKDLACLFSGLLAAAPDDEHVIRGAGELLQSLMAVIESSSRRLQLEGTLGAAEAIVKGAALGEVRALAGSIRKVASLEPPERGPARTRVEALTALASAVAAELES
jgi:hypothetical protein